MRRIHQPRPVASLGPITVLITEYCKHRPDYFPPENRPTVQPSGTWFAASEGGGSNEALHSAQSWKTCAPKCKGPLTFIHLYICTDIRSSHALQHTLTRTPSAAPHVSSLVTFALPAAHHLRLVITNHTHLLLTFIYSSLPHSEGLVNTWTTFLPKTTSFHQF